MGEKDIDVFADAVNVNYTQERREMPKELPQSLPLVVTAPSRREPFGALSGDPKIEQAMDRAMEMEKKGERINMRGLFSEAEERGEERGRADERRIIMGRLIAGGISPQQAAVVTGLASPIQGATSIS